FVQAEDGIRDWSVTGVQTCALPIWLGARHATDSRAWPPSRRAGRLRRRRRGQDDPDAGRSRLRDAQARTRRRGDATAVRLLPLRSEERRVGKEGRSRWTRDSERQKV